MYCLREHLNCHEQTVGRHRSVDENTEGNEEHVTENWRDPCYYERRLSKTLSYGYAKGQTYKK